MCNSFSLKLFDVDSFFWVFFLIVFIAAGIGLGLVLLPCQCVVLLQSLHALPPALLRAFQMLPSLWDGHNHSFAHSFPRPLVCCLIPLISKVKSKYSIVFTSRKCNGTTVNNKRKARCQFDAPHGHRLCKMLLRVKGIVLLIDCLPSVPETLGLSVSAT